MSVRISDVLSFHLEAVVTKANISFPLTSYVNSILWIDFTLPKNIVEVLSFFLYKVDEQCFYFALLYLPNLPDGG